MRLATYFLRGETASQQRLGVAVDDQMLDIAKLARAAHQAFPATMKELLVEGAAGLARVRELIANADLNATEATHGLDTIHFLPPVADANKFLCVGKNYRSHLEELKRTDLIKELPTEPTGFIKLNDCLVGHDTAVERPPTVIHLDYEPELVFVIGKPAYQVAAKDAFSYVAGITILNDLTCRDTQKREVASGSRFWTAKNAPGFGPLGPYIITMDEVPDPYDIWVTCSVNGEQRMRVNTSDQIWKLPQIIEHFSRLIPLMPGDMFSTGAPGGVAVGKPNAEELFLKHGDVVECAFENPSMVLRTHIVAPT